MNPQDRKQCLELVEDLQVGRQPEKLVKSDLPHILLPYQVAWHEDKAKVRYAPKARQIGFTWGCLACESVLEAMPSNGINQYYIGYSLEMAAQFIGDCAFFARAFDAALSKIFIDSQHMIVREQDKEFEIEVFKYSIRFPSGALINALSSNPRNFRSKHGHFRIDEAAFHDDLPALEKAAMAALIHGGRVDFISSLNGEDNPFYAAIEEVRAGSKKGSLHEIYFEDAVAQGLYERIALVHALPQTEAAKDEWVQEIRDYYGDNAAEELDGIPHKGGEIYFPRYLLKPCQNKQIPIVRWEQPPEFVTDDNRVAITQQWLDTYIAPLLAQLDPQVKSVLGHDFGRSGDLSVLNISQGITPEIWATRFMVELRNIPFDIQQQILFYILDRLPHFKHAKFDARGNGQSHAEGALQRYGVQKIDCVMFTAKWYAEHFPKLKRAYESRQFIIPDDEDVLQDHRLVELYKGSPTMSNRHTKGQDKKQRHGDAAVANVLTWAAALEPDAEAYGATVGDRQQAQQTYQSQRPSALWKNIKRNFFR